MVPLGKRFLVSDLIAALKCKVVVAARNKLGVINHTLLTMAMLEKVGVGRSEITVVLMGSAEKDASTVSNGRLLKEFLKGVAIEELGYLGSGSSTAAAVARNAFRVGWVRRVIA